MRSYDNTWPADWLGNEEFYATLVGVLGAYNATIGVGWGVVHTPLLVGGGKD